MMVGVQEATLWGNFQAVYQHQVYLLFSVDHLVIQPLESTFAEFHTPHD